MEALINLSEKKLSELETQFDKEFYLFSEREIKENLDKNESVLQHQDFLKFVKVSYARNPYLMKIVKKNKNYGAACSEMTELLIAEKAGFRESEVMFFYEGINDTSLLYANLRGFRLCVKSFENLIKAETVLAQLPYSVSLSQMQDTEVKKCFSYCAQKGVENIFINAENASLSETGRAKSKLELSKKNVQVPENCGLTVTLGENIFVPLCHNVPEFRCETVQYPGMFRHTELLERADGTIVKIRRSETIDEYFSGIDFSLLGSSCNHD